MGKLTYYGSCSSVFWVMCFLWPGDFLGGGGYVGASILWGFKGSPELSGEQKEIEIPHYFSFSFFSGYIICHSEKTQKAFLLPK